MKPLNPTLEPVQKKPDRIQIIIWSVLFVIMVALALRDYSSFQIGAYLDDAKYVLLTRAVVNSEQFGLHYSPGAVMPTPYPIGYPVLLAPLFRLFQENLDLVKISSLFFSCLNAALLFFGWRRLSSRSYWWGLAITGLYMLSPRTIEHTRMIMSEPVFITFCLLVMILAPGVRKIKQNSVWYAAISITMVSALLVRTAGLLLVLTVFFDFFLIKKWRIWKPLFTITTIMLAILAMIVVFTPFGIFDIFPSRYVSEWKITYMFQSDAAIIGQAIAEQSNAGLTNSGQADVEQVIAEQVDNNRDLYRSISEKQKDASIKRTFMENITRLIRSNFNRLLENLRILVLPIGGGETEESIAKLIGLPFLPIFLQYLILSLVVLGLGRLLKESIRMPALFSVIYIIGLAMWNWIDLRLLYPMQPFLMLSFLMGIEHLLTTAGKAVKMKDGKYSRFAINGLVFFLAVISIYSSLKIENTRDHAGDLEQRTRWIRENTDPTYIVMTETPVVDYMFSNRKTINFYDFFQAAHPVDFLKANQVDLILIAPHIYWRQVYTPNLSEISQNLVALLEKEPLQSQVELIHSSIDENIYIYRIKTY
ncbi:MAG: hypothetical protein JXA42_00635 [Anaerolineales bacterium]|nr:hypothetical protein [Anaerolineales bacterium]